MCYFVESNEFHWACNAMGVKKTTARPRHSLVEEHAISYMALHQSLLHQFGCQWKNNDEVVDAFWEEEPFDYCSCKEGKSLMHFINILFMQRIYMIEVAS